MADLGYKLTSTSSGPLAITASRPTTPKDLRALGYSDLTLDELRMARDHGVTPDYVKALASLGYSKLTLDELRMARDHGVTPDYVRQLALGYGKLPLDRVIQMRIAASRQSCSTNNAAADRAFATGIFRIALP